MAHRYHDLILVQRATGKAGKADVAAELPVGAPAAFFWHGAWYHVDAVLASWRLRDRWWAAPAADVADVADVARPTERTYYRVLCRDPAGEQVFDLYYDAASGQWMLDRAHD